LNQNTFSNFYVAAQRKISLCKTLRMDICHSKLCYTCHTPSKPLIKEEKNLLRVFYAIALHAAIQRHTGNAHRIGGSSYIPTCSAQLREQFARLNTIQ
jgi:hypothetical protein